MKKNKDFLNWIRKCPNGEAILFDTEAEFSYSDYLEYCNEEAVAPGRENSPEFYEWENMMRADYYNADRENIRCSKNCKRPVVVTGTIGRWNGKFKYAGSAIYPDLDSALTALITDEILDTKATYSTKCVELVARHHDASNVFDIWFLKDGYDKDKLQDLLDNGQFNPDGSYEKEHVIDEITDFLV